MKKLLLASAGILALGLVSASAADLPRHRAMPEKAPVYVPPPAWSWTGPYIGINGGWGFGRSDFSAPFPTGSFDTSGGLVGGTLGYNYQLDNNVVFGVEGDIDWSDIRGSARLRRHDVRNAQQLARHGARTSRLFARQFHALRDRRSRCR